MLHEHSPTQCIWPESTTSEYSLLTSTTSNLPFNFQTSPKNNILGRRKKNQF